MHEPFRTLYWTLMQANWSHWGYWRYNVRADHDRVLIGTDGHHITILSDHDGWHVTINGDHPGQVAGGFDDLLALRWDVTPEIGAALKWFGQNRSDM